MAPATNAQSYTEGGHEWISPHAKQQAKAVAPVLRLRLEVVALLIL
jgi:hypothetical protein